MLFNSIDFAVFLPIVFGIYWLIPGNRSSARNGFIILASYIFYGWWDWRFLSLIFISTAVDYSVGIGFSRSKELFTRKLLLWTSILVNLGILGFFKYYNFFFESFVSVFRFWGGEFTGNTFRIILPVGISFYTFQTLSYSIDIYRGKLSPTRNFLAFAAFVSFFPQLVAGPIERATNLLPQFFKDKNFDYAEAVEGCRQILWGLFKKIVIADNCALYVNRYFEHHSNYPGSVLIFGPVFFALQIYCDFSGYSDIAIGTSRLFGFKLRRNFAFPYFSRDIPEFWRRWHISLSTWFRDYLYIPLGGSRGSKLLKIRNIFAIFLVSGLWHGANWTFVAWGFIHALYFIPYAVLNRNRKYLDTVSEDRLLPSAQDLFRMGMTFSLTCFAWIFFRAENLDHAFAYLDSLLSCSLFSLPSGLFIYGHISRASGILLAAAIGGFLTIEWLGRRKPFALSQPFPGKPAVFRWIFYLLLIYITMNAAPREMTPFIYFQF